MKDTPDDNYDRVAANLDTLIDAILNENPTLKALDTSTKPHTTTLMEKWDKEDKSVAHYFTIRKKQNTKVSDLIERVAEKLLANPDPDMEDLLGVLIKTTLFEYT